jgi:hypothetical protein
MYTEYISNKPIKPIDCIEINTGDYILDTIPVEEFVIIKDDCDHNRFGTCYIDQYIERLPP